MKKILERLSVLLCDTAKKKISMKVERKEKLEKLKLEA